MNPSIWIACFLSWLYLIVMTAAFPKQIKWLFTFKALKHDFSVAAIVVAFHYFILVVGVLSLLKIVNII